jgi:hypothetical protein
MQPVQLSLIPDPVPGSSIDPVPTQPPAAPTVEQLPADAARTAIALLADVIARASAASRMEVCGDE